MSVTKNPAPRLAELLLVFGVLACSAPQKAGHSAKPAPSGEPTAASAPALEPPPWTDAFLQPTALLANEVRIEGPPGLISHVASVSNPDELDRTEKTVQEGFLQVISVKPEARGARITVQLDRLTVVALERVTILERTTGTTVVVTAKGDVYCGNNVTHEEKRGDTLRLEGKIVEKTGR